MRGERAAVASYSAFVPEPRYVAAAVVFTNRLRYPESCRDANGRRARYRSVADTLNVEQDATGRWRIGLRGDSDFLQGGARLLALSFDLAPAFVWGHITADVEATDPRYDDLAIFEALAVYRTGLGLDRGPDSQDRLEVAARGYVRQLARECQGG
jgi:hypothetical protein